mgnify:FL=1
MTATEVNATPDAGMQATTTDMLFPDFMESAEATLPEPKTEELAKEAPEILPELKTLTVDEYGDKMVKVKIEGVEKEVSFKDLLKGYQTDQYLTQKGHKIAEEKRYLDSLLQSRPIEQLGSPVPDENDDLYFNEVIKPQTEAIKQEIKQLKDIMAQTTQVIGPMQYRNDLEKLDTYMKQQGFDDFMAYVPQIENEVLHAPVEQMARMRSFETYAQLYQGMKLRDMKEQLAEIKNKPPEKPKLPDERPRPKISAIESAGATSSGADDEIASYNAAFKKATKTGDWSEVYRLKGIT